jgi:hypothetical protein
MIAAPADLFGFYPPQHYWRPVLALDLDVGGAGADPVSQVPRQILWFSAAYPFMAYFLLWGGQSGRRSWLRWALWRAMWRWWRCAPQARWYLGLHCLSRRYCGGCFLRGL